MTNLTPPSLDALLPAKISSSFGDRFVAAHDAMELYTRRTARELLPRIFGGALPESFSRAELLATGIVPDGEALADWLVRFLESFGDLRREGERLHPAFSEPIEERGPLRERAVAIEPSAAATYAIVDRCFDGAVDFLTGKASGESIVFALSALNLWFDYFDNRNFLYEINNRLAALVLADELAKGGGGGRRRVAEFGGGAGSAALAFLDEVASRGGGDVLGGPLDYVFTEPMAAFGRRGERNLKGLIPEGWGFTGRAVNLNDPLTGQGFEPRSCAAAWAVNTFHVARDLEQSLGYTREILEPGGVLVMGECVRPFPGQVLYTEFIFEFLANFRGIVTTPRRHTHGFLTPEDWIASVEAAGFRDVRLVPDIQAIRTVYPKFFTATVVARAA